LEYKFIPKDCMSESPTWAGSVTLKAPTFDEACEMGEKLALALVGVPEEIRGTRRVRELPKVASAMVLGLDLKRASDGKEFKSWEDLLKSTHGKLIVEIATAALNGPDTGNG
jgi:hypothetical protein